MTDAYRCLKMKYLKQKAGFDDDIDFSGFTYEGDQRNPVEEAMEALEHLTDEISVMGPDEVKLVKHLGVSMVIESRTQGSLHAIFYYDQKQIRYVAFTEPDEVQKLVDYVKTFNYITLHSLKAFLTKSCTFAGITIKHLDDRIAVLKGNDQLILSPNDSGTVNVDLNTVEEESLETLEAICNRVKRFVGPMQ